MRLGKMEHRQSQLCHAVIRTQKNKVKITA